MYILLPHWRCRNLLNTELNKSPILHDEMFFLFFYFYFLQQIKQTLYSIGIFRTSVMNDTIYIKRIKKNRKKNPIFESLSFLYFPERAVIAEYIIIYEGVWKVLSMVFYLSNQFTNPIMFGIILKRYSSSYSVIA